MAQRYPPGLVDAATGREPTQAAEQDLIRDGGPYTLLGDSQVIAVAETASFNWQANAPTTKTGYDQAVVAQTASFNWQANASSLRYGTVTIVAQTAGFGYAAQDADVLPGAVSVLAATGRVLFDAQPATSDAGGPRVVNKVPPIDGEVRRRSPLLCSIEDDTQVVLSSISIWVDGLPAYSPTVGFYGDWISSLLTPNESLHGYDLVLQPRMGWAVGEHTITIVAQDVNGKGMTATWAFFGAAKAFTFTTLSFVYSGVRKADGEDEA